MRKYDWIAVCLFSGVAIYALANKNWLAFIGFALLAICISDISMLLVHKKKLIEMVEEEMKNSKKWFEKYKTQKNCRNDFS